MSRIDTLSLTQLQNLIDTYDQRYYNHNGVGATSDKEYDLLKRRLKALSPNDERLSRVGAPLSHNNHRKTVKHFQVIGSLNDVMNEGELKKWWNGPSIATHKIDGLTLVCTYKQGKLITAVTRGNGLEGMDVTANAIQAGVPTVINLPLDIVIRGEIYLKVSEMNKINKELEEDGDDPFKNPRNAASGILSSDDGKYADRLEFLAHGIYDSYLEDATVDKKFTFNTMYNVLVEMGFDTPWQIDLDTFEDAVEAYRELAIERAKLDYWIDGMVIIRNDVSLYLKEGYSNNRPKMAVALKFKSEEVETVLIDCIFNTGHTGKITPVAELRPVQLGGSTVSNATLCNWDNIESLDVAIGDTVVVAKAGDIIPRILRVSQKGKNRRLLPKLTACPACNGKVSHNKTVGGDDTADLFCENKDCPARKMGRINRWIKSLEIKWIGPEVLKAFIDSGMVQGIYNLYEMADDKGYETILADMRVGEKRFGEKKTKSVMDEVKKTKELTIAQFLGSLGIKGLGKRRVENIIKNAEDKLKTDDLNDIEKWFDNGKEVPFLRLYSDELGIPNIADGIQESLDECRDEINRLLKHITIVQQKKEIKTMATGKLSGKVFCLTGKFSVQKSEYHEKIVALGGSFEADFNKNVNTLVTADPSNLTGKTKKAKSAGIPVISEEELVEMLG